MDLQFANLVSEKHNRLSEFKTRSVICDQETRRFESLQNQKRKRENTVNQIRNITDLLSDFENEDDFEERQEVEEEFMEWTDTKPKFSRLKDMFMLSEWMVNLPENLEDKWLFVLCPVGKRCLVRCSKGCTTVYGKRGHILAKFQSLLPNGSRKDYSRMRYANSDVTILDCVWNAELKSYFILDLLSWKGQFYMDTETSFRSFWIRSKFQESSYLSEKSEENPFPFIPLSYYHCDLHNISSVLSTYPYFPSDKPQIDGVLFYHSEGYYTPGSTPLVVWLKLFMIPEALGVEISMKYFQTKPSSYVNMNQYIVEFEERKKKGKFRKKKKNVGKEEESTREIEMLE